MAIKYYCDWCGKQIHKEDREYEEGTMDLMIELRKIMRTGYESNSKDFHSYLLCVGCGSKIMDYCKEKIPELKDNIDVAETNTIGDLREK